LEASKQLVKKLWKKLSKAALDGSLRLLAYKNIHKIHVVDVKNAVRAFVVVGESSDWPQSQSPLCHLSFTIMLERKGCVVVSNKTTCEFEGA